MSLLKDSMCKIFMKTNVLESLLVSDGSTDADTVYLPVSFQEKIPINPL